MSATLSCNIVEDHIKTTLSADSVLGGSGDLKITTFEAERRESVDEYMSHEMPVCVIEVEMSSEEKVTIGGEFEHSFLGNVYLICEAGAATRRRELVKNIAAEVERVLRKQVTSTENMSYLAAAVTGGEEGSVETEVAGTAIQGGEGEHGYRAVSMTSCVVKVSTVVDL